MRNAPGSPEPRWPALLLALGVGAACVVAGVALGYYGLPWLLS